MSERVRERVMREDAQKQLTLSYLSTLIALGRLIKDKECLAHLSSITTTYFFSPFCLLSEDIQTVLEFLKSFYNFFVRMSKYVSSEKLTQIGLHFITTLMPNLIHKAKAEDFNKIGHYGLKIV